jgi:hypothetical protein
MTVTEMQILLMVGGLVNYIRARWTQSSIAVIFSIVLTFKEQPTAGLPRGCTFASPPFPYADQHSVFHTQEIAWSAKQFASRMICWPIIPSCSLQTIVSTSTAIRISPLAWVTC